LGSGLGPAGFNVFRVTSDQIESSSPRKRGPGQPLPRSPWTPAFAVATIKGSIVIEDGRLNRRMPDQPYNLAMVTLDADPRVNFYSNLPGTPPYQAPVGAAVELTFEDVAPDQLIHEWRVVA
jgi:hypothetical protein